MGNRRWRILISHETDFGCDWRTATQWTEEANALNQANDDSNKEQNRQRTICFGLDIPTSGLNLSIQSSKPKHQRQVQSAMMVESICVLPQIHQHERDLAKEISSGNSLSEQHPKTLFEPLPCNCRTEEMGPLAATPHEGIQQHARKSNLTTLRWKSTHREHRTKVQTKNAKLGKKSDSHAEQFQLQHSWATPWQIHPLQSKWRKHLQHHLTRQPN